MLPTAFITFMFIPFSYSYFVEVIKTLPRKSIKTYKGVLHTKQSLNNKKKLCRVLLKPSYLKVGYK